MTYPFLYLFMFQIKDNNSIHFIDVRRTQIAHKSLAPLFFFLPCMNPPVLLAVQFFEAMQANSKERSSNLHIIRYAHINSQRCWKVAICQFFQCVNILSKGLNVANWVSCNLCIIHIGFQNGIIPHDITDLLNQCARTNKLAAIIQLCVSFGSI